MFESDKIKRIIFDYGGTIDSHGMRWAEVKKPSAKPMCMASVLWAKIRSYNRITPSSICCA